MRGVINVSIRRRVMTSSKAFRDMWEFCDTLILYTIQKGYYRIISKFYGDSYTISKDELAFVRFVYKIYGPGDYSILTYGKGKEKGRRRFWDGLITQDGRFMRRKDASYSEYASLNQINYIGQSLNTESYISRYMKPKRAGVWHNL